jgi:hypothetical protein
LQNYGTIVFATILVNIIKQESKNCNEKELHHTIYYLQKRRGEMRICVCVSSFIQEKDTKRIKCVIHFLKYSYS